MGGWGDFVGRNPCPEGVRDAQVSTLLLSDDHEFAYLSLAIWSFYGPIVKTRLDCHDIAIDHIPGSVVRLRVSIIGIVKNLAHQVTIKREDADDTL